MKYMLIENIVNEVEILPLVTRESHVLELNII